MARRSHKRSTPSVPVKAVNDKSENYEGDDEGRDEESPPLSPVLSKGRMDNGTAAEVTEPASETSKRNRKTAKVDNDVDAEESEPPRKNKKTAKLDNGVSTEESEPVAETSKKNKKAAKLDNGEAMEETEPVAETSKKNKKGKSKKDEEFEVEQIVGMEVNFRWGCPVRFRVRWVGYTEKDDTWVSVYNLNCENFVQDFLSISGRTSEYERAMERAQRSTMVNTEYRESLRKRSRPEYCEDSDGDEEVLMTTSTRTRKTRRPDMFDPAEARPQLAKSTRKQPPKVGVSRAHALAQQAGREYEVVLITDHRVRGRFTEYKVRWKGLSSSHDSWVPEANLTCPKLIADYLKSIKSEPEQEYEVAAIIDSREVDGAVSYKVRWKGFSAKFDSWLPKDEMNCTEMIKKFEDALEKLNKKEDWVVKKIRDERKRGGITEYLVNWEGFERKFDTWEPEENLEGCRDKLDEFYSHKEKKTKKQTAAENEDSDQESGKEPEIKEESDEEVTVQTSTNKRRRSHAAPASKQTKKQTAAENEDSDQESGKEPEIKEESDEEVTVQTSTNKRRRSHAAPASKTPATQSKDARKRRITLPVSYDEHDDLSD